MVSEKESKKEYYDYQFDKDKPAVYTIHIGIAALTYVEAIKYLEEALEDVKKYPSFTLHYQPLNNKLNYPSKYISNRWMNITEEENNMIKEVNKC